MEQTNRISKRALDPETLTKLQSELPWAYYESFKTAYQKQYPKQRIPARQTVYKVINGKSTNTKILAVLTTILESQAEVKTKLKDVLAAC